MTFTSSSVWATCTYHFLETVYLITRNQTSRKCFLVVFHIFSEKSIKNLGEIHSPYNTHPISIFFTWGKNKIMFMSYGFSFQILILLSYPPPPLPLIFLFLSSSQKPLFAPPTDPYKMVISTSSSTSFTSFPSTSISKTDNSMGNSVAAIYPVAMVTMATRYVYGCYSN